jgi:hypothetical protein
MAKLQAVAKSTTLVRHFSLFSFILRQFHPMEKVTLASDQFFQINFPDDPFETRVF